MQTRRVLVLLALLSMALHFSGSPAVAAAPGGERQLEFGIKMAQRGLWSEALFRFRQAEKAEPASVSVLNNLAVACEAVGLFEEALEYYQKALKIDPGNRELKRNYSRFAEFYQAFKPDEEEATVTADDGGEDEDRKAEVEELQSNESAF